MKRTSLSRRCIAAGAVGVLLALSACSSDNDSISVSLDGEARTSAAGIYDGRIFFDDQSDAGERWQLWLAEPPTGSNQARIVGISRTNPQRLLVGQYARTAQGLRISASLNLYDFVTYEIPVEASDDPDAEVDEETEPEFFTRRRVRLLTADGSFDSPRTFFDGDFTGQDQGRLETDPGDFQLRSVGDGRFDTSYLRLSYERLTPLQELAGQWVRKGPDGFVSQDFTINSEGGITGRAFDALSGNDCDFEGTVKLVNPRFNLFAVAMTQSDCGELPPDPDAPPGAQTQSPDFELIGLMRLGAIDQPQAAAFDNDRLQIIAGSSPGPIGSRNRLVDARFFSLERQP